MSPEERKTHHDSRLPGQYANYLEVGHNAHEFILDFGQFHQGDEEPKFVARIIANPHYLKGFMKTLSQSIERYEQTHGPIEEELPPNYLA